METNLKIIHLILGKANPNRMNGINKVVYHLANAQSSMGLNVSVWGITHDITAAAEYERKFTLKLFVSHRFKLDRSLKNAIRSVPEGAVFHIHGGFVYDFFLAAKLMNRVRIPFVFTPHGSYNKIALNKSYWIKKVYYSLFERRMLKYARILHLIGESERKSLKDPSIENKISLIPNGQLPAVRTKNTFAESRPVFGFMGRILIHTKGLDLLFEGFNQYKKEGGSGLLWIMGDGNELPRLKSMSVQLGIENDMVFHGAVYGPEKLNLITQLSAFYHTSRNEGMPGAVLEAASMGIPGVVSQETNVLGYIADYVSGIGLKENDFRHIADSMHEIESLLVSGEIQKLSMNAKRMIAEAFSWENIASKMVRNYAS